jgi:hypothetical protein
MFGIVYKITGGGDECYVGSTCKTIEERMIIHKYDYNFWKKNNFKFCSSIFLFEKYGFKNCKISILEEVACNTKRDLRKIEEQYIQKLIVVNKNKAARKDMLYRKGLKDKVTIHIDDGASLSTQ